MLQCYSLIIDIDISAHVHDKEVYCGLNDIDKRYIYQLMSNFELPRSKTFYLHIIIHSITQNNDVSLAKELQKHLSKEHQKHGVVDRVKYRKRSNEIKWTDREYDVQDNADASHK